MNRTALRISAVAALLNGGNGPPWPTLAGEFIYDSLMDDITDTVGTKRKPVVVVRTDDDVSSYNQNAFAGRQCRLYVECSVVTSVTEKVNGAEQLRLDWPKTDPILEAMLDALEWHCWLALMGHNEWAVWFRNVGVYSGIFRYASTPRYSQPERGAVRLAVRTLEFLVKLPTDCIPNPQHELDPLIPASLPPLLVLVLNHILHKGSGEYRKTILAMARSLLAYAPVERPVYPALQRVWVTLPQYEIEADWKIEQTARLTAVPISAGVAAFSSPDLTSP